MEILLFKETEGPTGGDNGKKADMRVPSLICSKISKHSTLQCESVLPSYY